MITVLLISILFQLVAVFFALRLIRLTKQYYAWILIASAIIFMAVRRIISLVVLINQNSFTIVNPAAEYVALLISGLLAIGIILIEPLFKSIKKNEFDLGLKNNTLEDNNIHIKQINEELIRAKEKAEEGEIKFLAALESMSDAVFIADKAGGINNVNKSYLKLLEFKSINEMVTQFEEYPELFEVYFKTGEVAPIEKWAVPRALSGETAVNEIYKIKRKDRDYFWIGSYNFAPILVNNQIAGCVVTIRDVTDEIKRNKELEKHRMHLEELVIERTRELEVKNDELQKFNDLFVDREFRINELKDQVKELEQKLNTFEQNNSNQ